MKNRMRASCFFVVEMAARMWYNVEKPVKEESK